MASLMQEKSGVDRVGGSVLSAMHNEANGHAVSPPPGASSDTEEEVTLSLEDVYNRIGFGWQQWRVLIVCGLCFCTDSIEVGLLSFLQIKAAEEFNLSPLQESLLTSIVFAGELLGALCFGPLADRVGRWRATFLSAILITVAGLLSAFSTTFAMLVVMRAVVGVGIGGLAVPFDILAEFMPTHIRGKALMGIEYFWTMGTVYVNGLAWLSLEALGWRYLIGLSAIPVVLAIFSFPLLPESPHWLMSVGREAEAECVLRRAAILNGRMQALPRRLKLVITHPVKRDAYEPVGDEAMLIETFGHIKEDTSPWQLFSKEWRMTTAMLWLVWLTSGFTYYGAIIVGPEVFKPKEGEEFDYSALFISSLAEVMSCTIAFILIERVGRKPLSGYAYIVSGIFLLILVNSNMPRAAAILCFMFARGGSFIGVSTTWVMTPELYPTNIRAAGHSWANALARIGAFLTPYWGDARHIEFPYRLMLYGIISFVSATGSFLMPRETLGAALVD